MSDPVTNVEIEDVLASIRRLVSDESAVAHAADGPAASKADKLVLTPSLRVMDTASAENPAEMVEDATPQEQPQEPVSDAVAEPFVMRLDSPVAMPDEAAEPAAALDDVPLEERIADLEAQVAQTDEDWEPEGSEEDAFGDIEAPFWAEDDSDDSEEYVAEIAQLHPAAEAGEPIEDPAAEVPATESVEAWDEDELEFVADVTVEAELAEPEPLDYEAPEQDDTAADAVEDMAGLGVAENLLDEEMLRDLVTEIVRQELQGSLGERITRNVRKLVRREIQRALTSRDMS